MSQDWFSAQAKNTKSLGELIKKHRMELGLTQEQLAELISTETEYVRQSDISNLERGRVKLPRRERLERLAIALQTTLGELLARSGWAEADRYLVAALLGVPDGAASETHLSCQAIEDLPSTGHWWMSTAQAARIVRVRLAPGYMESVVSRFRNAALWMATSEEGFRGFVLMSDERINEIVSVGFWDSEQSMRNSPASVYLPLKTLQFQHVMTEPATIDHFDVASCVGRTEQRSGNRLSQLDLSVFRPENRRQVIEQFHLRAEGAIDTEHHLKRSVLLFNGITGRTVAVGIWPERARTPPQQEPQDSSDPFFPQLIESATSHHYRVEMEV